MKLLLIHVSLTRMPSSDFPCAEVSMRIKKILEQHGVLFWTVLPSLTQ